MPTAIVASVKARVLDDHVPSHGSLELVRTCLARLRPHVSGDAAAITGSVASGLRAPGDLDLVIADRSAIAPSVCADFLVNHCHDGERLLYQLVYAEDVDARCERCAHAADPRFPLSPKQAIRAVLGYV